MKKTLLFMALLCVLNSFSQSILSSGDLAITGFNADGPDNFSFVLLADVSAGTQILFTENGWDAGAFRTSEGTITWTASAPLSCGTEITLTNSTASTGVVTVSGSWALSTSGDQIFAFQGSLVAPNLLFAVNFDGAGWNSGGNSTSTDLPPALVDGIDAVNLGEIDNAQYTCSVFSDQTAIFAAITSVANWSLSNSEIIPIASGCAFTCAPACTPPSIASYFPSSGPVGTAITITALSGDLSGASATFGGVPANVISSSSSVLVISVPSGSSGTDFVISDSQACEVTQIGFSLLDSDAAGCDFIASFSELFISEVTDASSGSLSYIEIFNATGATVDMTDYEVQIRNNGAVTGADIALTGTLAHGDSFILATAVGSGCPVIGGSAEYADQTDVSSGVNNNDCIHLARLGTRIDTWGVCDGSAWITAAGYGTAGYDFQRLTTATAPSTSFNITDWNVIDYDACNDSYDNIQSYDGVNPIPIITSQPAVSLSPCDIATTLSVSAVEGVLGGQTLVYQWYYTAPGDIGWTALTNSGVYSGSQTNTLTISNVIGLDEYQFYCQVLESSATCYQVSEAVTLNVTLAAIWDGSSWTVSPDNTKFVFVTGNYDTSSQGSFEACNLLVDTGAALTIAAGDYVRVINDVVVNGELEVLHEGSFVQVSDAGTVSLNAGGDIAVHKTTTALIDWWAYTFWSSPIQDETIGSALVTSNPDYRFVFNPSNYSDVSPADGLDDNADDWTWVGPATVMTPGLGYVAMGPTTGVYPQTQSVTFKGTLNNGVINVPISTAGNPDDWNLIGNPYASAVDFHDFYAANSATLQNTIYLWNHISAPLASNSGPYGQNFDTDDFASYNAAIASGTAANSGGAIPTRYIASGQSFFIEGTANGTAFFNNSMREIDNNGGFYFTTDDAAFAAENTAVNRDLLWLNVINEDTRVFNQLLIGFVAGATYQEDQYDSKKRLSPYISFYSMIGTKGFAIQGRAPLQNNEERIPLGISSKIPSEQTLEVTIDQFEGLKIPDYEIYLEDSQEGILHDLRQSNYSFKIGEGVHEDRFVLVLKRAVLNTDPVIADQDDLMILNEGDVLRIFSVHRKIIEAIAVYDVLGKRVCNLKDLNTTTFEGELSALLSNSVYVVRVEFEDNTYLNKQFIRR